VRRIVSQQLHIRNSKDIVFGGKMKVVLLLIFLLGFDGASSAYAGEEQITPADLLDVTEIRQMLMSPDGASLLVQVSRRNLKANVITNKWLIVRTRTGEVAQEIPKKWDDALEQKRIGWSPDSRSIVIWEMEDGNVYLRQLNLQGLSTERITDASLSNTSISIAGIADPWSPDGRYFLYKIDQPIPSVATESADSGARTGVNADVNWVYGTGMPDAARDAERVQEAVGENTISLADLWILDEKTELRTKVSACGDWATEAAWVKDDRVVCVRSGLHFKGEAARQSLVSVDVATGLSRDMGEYGYPERVAPSPDGTKIAMTSGHELVIMNSDGSTPTIIVNLKSMLVTKDYFFIGRLSWTADGEKVVFVMQGHMSDTLFEADVRSRTVRAVCPDNRYYSHLQFGGNSGLVGVVAEDLGEPQRVYLVNTSTWKFRPSFDPNEYLRKLPWPSIRELHWKSSDGRFIIHGVLLSPSSRSAGRPRPLLVENNGGPGPVFRVFNGEKTYPLPVFTSLGYSVLLVHSRGRSGYGDAFTMALRDERSTFAKPLADVLGGIDTLVKLGIADPKRLGMLGSSYGGALTAWAACSTNRFRAVSILEGAPLDETDVQLSTMGNPQLRSYLTTTYLGQRVPYLPAERKLAEAESPLYHVADVRTPSVYEGGILSLASREGRPWYQAMQFFHVPSELVVYPRSGHGWTEPALLLDSYKRNIAWFGYWLKDDPYPDKERQREYDAWKERRASLGDPRWTVRAVEADHRAP
jgi:dipeptidyl aminopeptidase/acylaminoacyl peptidase